MIVGFGIEVPKMSDQLGRRDVAELTEEQRHSIRQMTENGAAREEIHQVVAGDLALADADTTVVLKAPLSSNPKELITILLRAN